MEPSSEAELADAIRAATGPLTVRGGDTRLPHGPGKGDPLGTSGLRGVRLYEPGALTLVAGAGTPMSEIDAILAEKGQRLAFEPMDPRALMAREGEPTLGGAVAANVSGPRRMQAGACRDFLLGVRFVDGTGSIVSNGGRVMKNVTGYDLVKLMAGSHGTLGVLSEVSLKVMAVPQAEATLVQRGLDPDAALSAMMRAMQSPFEITGAAHLDGTDGRESETRIRIEGMRGSVAYRSDRLAEDICRGWEPAGDEDSARMWRELRDMLPFAGRPGTVWRLSVTPARSTAILAGLRAKGLTAEAILDWGGGRIWVRVPDGPPDGGAGAIRGTVDATGGHATLIRAAPAILNRVPLFHPGGEAVERLARGLRARFDPRGLFNPGLMDAAVQTAA